MRELSDYEKVLRTLKNNKIMVKETEEGIFIRLAGVEKRQEIFSLDWVKILNRDL